MSRFRALASVLSLVLAPFALPQSALADKRITVGNGTAASCTEMALKHALLIAETIGGAKIHFKCGRQPASIALSAVTEIHGMLILLVLPNNTTIDGGGLITLDGSDTATVVFVDRGTTAVLKGLIIINGVVADILGGGPAGGIVNFGTLTIYNGGTLKIKDSTFSHNNAGDGIGGAIYNDGTLTVGHSTFSEYNVGTLKINHSTRSGNRTSQGGGIYNFGHSGPATARSPATAPFREADSSHTPVPLLHSPTRRSPGISASRAAGSPILALSRSTTARSRATLAARAAASSTRTRSPSITASSPTTPRTSVAVSTSALTGRCPSKSGCLATAP